MFRAQLGLVGFLRSDQPPILEDVVFLRDGADIGGSLLLLLLTMVFLLMDAPGAGHCNSHTATTTASRALDSS